MNTYRVSRDPSQAWLVEKREPFFELPLVVACYKDRKSAYAHAKTLREQHKDAWSRNIHMPRGA